MFSRRNQLKIVQFLSPIYSVSCLFHHDVFLIKIILYEQVSPPIPALVTFCPKLSANNKERHDDDDNEQTEDGAHDLLQGEGVSPRQHRDVSKVTAVETGAVA